MGWGRARSVVVARGPSLGCRWTGSSVVAVVIRTVCLTLLRRLARAILRTVGRSGARRTRRFGFRLPVEFWTVVLPLH